MKIISGIKPFLLKNWSRTLVVLGGIGLAVIGSIQDIQKNNWSWFIKNPAGITFTVSALATILGSAATWKEAQLLERQAKEIIRLEGELENELILQPILLRLIVKCLNLISNELKFSSNERISLYIHNRRKNFVLIGRYSKNPNLNRVRVTSLRGK
ncbi:hypothetical protein [Pantanalinema sp. GBBB05]|uniref:hypothetical protein n=1 Tax=Pantanalinema sp. GBBB05 TaxID=2604139 RepID=UPI001DB87468|nr:hypothetical protein [Pantanalinema sp. GBBB05]